MIRILATCVFEERKKKRENVEQPELEDNDGLQRNEVSSFGDTALDEEGRLVRFLR